MGTNSTSTTTEAEAEALLAEIRQIMADTGLAFGPAVNVYIKRKYDEIDLDRPAGVC